MTVTLASMISDVLGSMNSVVPDWQVLAVSMVFLILAVSVARAMMRAAGREVLDDYEGGEDW